MIEAIRHEIEHCSRRERDNATLVAMRTPTALHLAFLGSLLFVASTCLLAQPYPTDVTRPPAPSLTPAEPDKPAARPQSADEANARLLALLAEDVEAQKKHDPVSASRRGDRRFDALLPDVSGAGEKAFADDAATRLGALLAVDQALLTPDNRVSSALLQRELEERMASFRFGEWQAPVTPLSGPQQWIPNLPEVLTFPDRIAIADFLTRIQRVPDVINQTMANMREGYRSGRTPPREVLGRVAAQAASVGAPEYITDLTTHPLYAPFRSLDFHDVLARDAREAIRTQVIPSFRAFAAFLENEYVPRCRLSTAAADLPAGEAYYQWRLRSITTTDLTPDQIHDLGLSEVKRIREEMLRVIALSDFPRRKELASDPDAMFRGFLEYLRTDPRFYFTRPEDLLGAYRDAAKRIDAELPRLFRTMPRLSYGVREMPAFIAPSQTTAFYQPGSLESGVAGYFVANTHKLDQRPKYDIIPLTLHEASPGHHFQIALAQEMTGVPEWRTRIFHTAFIEGWALYAERLGLEVGDGPPPSHYGDSGDPAPQPAPGAEGYLGFYQNPYDNFGRLTYEMWRAMRLVVDTGLHHKKWSRSQAIQFMLDNSGLTQENVEREVDRYIAWPGQACAYKIGELRIRELRSRAEASLGARFDRRAFHDAVLRSGSVPLDVLEQQIKDWIETQKGEKR